MAVNEKELSRFKQRFYDLPKGSTEKDAYAASREHNRRMILDSEPGSYKNHKYLYKYKTKDGKVRYVYKTNETQNGGIRDYGEDSIQNQTAMRKGGEGRRNNQYLMERQQTIDDTKEHAAKTFDSIKNGNFNHAAYYVNKTLSDVGHLATYALDSVGDTIADGADFVKSFFK